MKPGQESVLHDLAVVDCPEHGLPPLEACCMMLRKPNCVPPPHVLSHDNQVQSPHAQFTGDGGGGGGAGGCRGGAQAKTMVVH